LALQEDLGQGDITSLATIGEQATGLAQVRAKQDLIVSGATLIVPLWEIVDPEVSVVLKAQDGDRLAPGETLAEINGRVRSLLAGERTCLNFLCHLCGIATLTARYVAAVGSRKARILDTRKTTPGYRELDKEAVRHGGGINHRRGLYDQILIKDNHLEAGGGVTAAIEKARAYAPDLLIEVEVRNEDELRAALTAEADIILLDNMNVEQIRRCVEVTAGRARLEVSGGVTLKQIPELAATGVDRISIGALTHSAPAADLHMKLVSEP